ncbi:hypothetical protein NSQ26_09725 [Bacillus sp. FSL W7-1360]
MTKQYDQVEYNKRWAEKNKDHKRYLRYRSQARTFIRKHATNNDLDELEKLIKQKRDEL